MWRSHVNLSWHLQSHVTLDINNLMSLWTSDFKISKICIDWLIINHKNDNNIPYIHPRLFFFFSFIFIFNVIYIYFPVIFWYMTTIYDTLYENTQLIWLLDDGQIKQKLSPSYICNDRKINIFKPTKKR